MQILNVKLPALAHTPERHDFKVFRTIETFRTHPTFLVIHVNETSRVMAGLAADDIKQKWMRKHADRRPKPAKKTPAKPREPKPVVVADLLAQIRTLNAQLGIK
jgi:hypothetical protein